MRIGAIGRNSYTGKSLFKDNNKNNNTTSPIVNQNFASLSSS